MTTAASGTGRLAGDARASVTTAATAAVATRAAAVSGGARHVWGVESDAAKDYAAERRDSTRCAVDWDVNAVRGEGGNSADAGTGTNWSGVHERGTPAEEHFLADHRQSESTLPHGRCAQPPQKFQTSV